MNSVHHYVYCHYDPTMILVFCQVFRLSGPETRIYPMSVKLKTDDNVENEDNKDILLRLS